VIAQQFTEVNDWPFGSAIACVVIVAMNGRAARVSRCWRTATRATQWLGGCSAAIAALVFVFLYAPIVGRHRLRVHNGGRR
jgi:ABC-type spermidine/putrescine transport system permease subunit I